jgi:ubiquinol-cytochrome c reductase cytochrome c1 subunit
MSFASNSVKLQKVDIDVEDRVALLRGAKVFFDKCQGCHGLKYMRYSNLAENIGLNSTKDKSFDIIIREQLMHSTNKVSENSPILSSITKENGVNWFGKTPPDLSLTARYRGSDWIYTYMKSFYKDSSRPWGVNNLVYPDVGMPHILSNLQGIQILKDNIENSTDIDQMLYCEENGEYSKSEYDNLIKDLVTFLSYVSEPTQSERKNLGYNVLLFLLILSALLYMLKKEYWKDVK